VWKKIKVIFITIGIIVLTVLAFVFRSRSDGSGVSGADKLNRDISDGLGRVQDSIDGSASNIGQGSEKVEDVIEGIEHTENKLQSALEILRAAKEKNRPPLAG